MDARRRRTGFGLAALLAVLALVLASCSGDAKPNASFAARPATGLASLLEPAPKYTGPGGSKWALDYTPSLEQYLEHFYQGAKRDTNRTELQRQGLQEIAHTLWITDNKIQNDVVLLRFASSDGAIQRLSSTNKINSANSLLKSYTIDAPANPVVYYTEQAVNDGFRLAETFAQFGLYVVEMFTYYPDTVPRLQIERWINVQVQRLNQ